MDQPEYDELLERFYEWYPERPLGPYALDDLAPDGLFEWFDTLCPDFKKFLAEYLVPAKPPRVVVDFSGGIDNGAWADQEVEVMVVDFDDTDGRVKVIQEDKKHVWFWWSDVAVTVDSEEVDRYFLAPIVEEDDDA